MKKTKEKNDSIKKYTKNNILKSFKYSERKDILNIFLEENKEYTLEEIDKIIDSFMMKGVD